MQMALRPGEALVWRWGHLKPARHMSPNQFLYPDNICNGLWEYRPDFGGEVWKKGAMKVENVVSGPEGLAAENGRTGASHAQLRIKPSGQNLGGRTEVLVLGHGVTPAPFYRLSTTPPLWQSRLHPGYLHRERVIG